MVFDADYLNCKISALIRAEVNNNIGNPGAPGISQVNFYELHAGGPPLSIIQCGVSEAPVLSRFDVN
jgi:hypothetical protein